MISHCKQHASFSTLASLQSFCLFKNQLFSGLLVQKLEPTAQTTIDIVRNMKISSETMDSKQQCETRCGCMDGPDLPQHSTAYTANLGAHRRGITRQEVTRYYDDWAARGTYEQDLCPERYRGPEIAASALASLYQPDERTRVTVLDVAAGTGLLGIQLVSHGFTVIDALDPSRGMLRVAAQKNIYRRLMTGRVGDQPCQCADGEYDAVLVSGGMGEGHIPLSGLNEMARITKPGGLVVIVMRREYLDEVEEYRHKLDQHVEDMQRQGTWSLLQRTIVPNYSFNKEGILFIFRISTKK